MKNILIVYDYSTVRRIVRMGLKAGGFRVTEAGDGLEALEQLGRAKFDLVITDLNMPRMDGYELTREIRKIFKDEELPIIMLTTEGSEADRKRGLELGVNLYLVKPCSSDMLLFKVESLLHAGSNV